MVYQLSAVDVFGRKNSPEEQTPSIVGDSNECHLPAEEIRHTDIK
jgi:hypothetical protein